MKIFSCILTASFLFSCTHRYSGTRSGLSQSMEASIESEFRSHENRERDKYQHPEETLSFFGLKPQMTIVEVSPGAGYFTEILASYLSEAGQLYLSIPRMPPRPPIILVENEKKIQDILLRHSQVQNKTKLIPFEPADKRNRIPKGFADAVVTFNTIHNMVAKNSAHDSFKIFYELLKPGGILGVVQHRVREGQRKIPKSGYMYEREVIALANKAGFKLVAKSEINTNPKDMANYPGGVWTLPPYFRLGEKNREKYEDIGESDRMTLKFVKP